MDRPLLNERHLLYRQFDAEVSPSDHDSVERLDNLFEILHRLGLFDLREYRHPNAFVVHDVVKGVDIVSAADKGQGDEIRSRAKPPAKILHVLVRHSRHAHGNSREVEALVIGHQTTLDDRGVDTWPLDLGHPQFDATIIDKNEISRIDIVR